MIVSSIVAGYSGSSLTAHTVLNRDIARYKDLLAKEPTVKNEIDYVKANIGKISSLDDLLDDYRVFRFTLTAFGLEDQQYARAMMKRTIEEGTGSPKDFANQLLDTRYREMSEFVRYDYERLGRLKDPKWVDQLVEKYVNAQFEKEIGQVDENLRMALYFERKAPKMTSWYQIMGDKPLYQAALKMAGLPKEAAQMDVDKQVEIFKKKIDIKDFRNPQKLAKHLETFLARADAESGAAVAKSPVVQLMQPASNNGFGPLVTIDPTLFIGIKSFR